MAIGTPVVGAAAYSASGGTSVAPAYPSGILATDVVLLFVGQKPSTANGGTATTPSGWTLRDELLAAGGYGTTLGADTGNTNLRIYSWDSPVAGQTGTCSVTLAQNNISWAFIVRIPKGGGALGFGSADGQRTTAPTSPLSIALTNGASATNFQSGDLAIWAMCIPTDVTTPSQFSAQSITATGATFGTAVELNEPDRATGNDIGGYSAYALVSSGSSTTAPTVQTNLAGTLTNVRGPVVLLRVREAAPTPVGTGAITLGGATVSGSGSPTLAASGAVDLATAAVSGTVDVTPPGVDASGAVTLDTVVVSGVGRQTHNATGAVALGAVTVAGVGRQTHNATGAVTLGAVSVAGVGSSTVQASASVSLASVSVAGVGSPVIVASGAVTLGAVVVTGLGTSTAQALGAIALDAVSVAGVGDVVALAITATGAVALDAATVAGVGTSTVQATGAMALGAVSVAGVGSSTVQGGGAVTLGAAVIAASGAQLFPKIWAEGWGTVAWGTSGDALGDGVLLFPGPVVGQLACVAPSIGGLVLSTPGTAALACVAPSLDDLVCTVASAASLACVVRNVWALPPVSFTRPASP